MTIESFLRSQSIWIRILCLPLFILSGLFWIATVIRARYLRHIRATRHCATPVWTVGNISVGGSGKTPCISWLIQHMSQYKLAIVSSGYARESSNNHWRPPFGQIDRACLGDEMTMLALQFPHIGCSVATNKWNAIQAIPPGFDYIIVDDGLQRYDIPFTRQIATVDMSNKDTYVLPRGLLREPMARLKTVDCIVLTNPPSCDYCALQHEWMERYQCPVAIADSVITHFFTQDGSTYQIPPHTEVALISAIARPERFACSIQKLGLTIKDHCILRDHRNISDPQLQQFAQSAGCVIIATQKDFARKQHWPQLCVPCVFAAHSFVFIVGEEYIRGFYERC